MEKQLLLDCQMITRDGKIVHLRQCADNGLYHDYDMHLVDGMDRLYQKELWSTKIFRCDSCGTPNYAIGKLDVVKLWEEFGKVPINSENNKIESDWGVFPAGSEKETVCHWFEKELGVSVHDLTHNIFKVDNELLTFNAVEYNIEDNIKFRQLDRNFLITDEHRFTHVFKEQDGCIIYKEANITSISDKEKGIEQYLVLGNWRRSASMPLGEYATWIVSNDTSDKSFILKNGASFPSCFYDSKNSVVNAVQKDFTSRLMEERSRIYKENKAFKFGIKSDRGFVQ